MYSQDIVYEYYKKLKQLNISQEIIEELVFRIRKTAREVQIEFSHLEKYPTDTDDIAFLLCAVNGQATHLITYDPHLLELNPYYDFKICKSIPFLEELRNMLEKL